MLVRLWWKEFRVFGPVWLTLVVTATLFQWVMLATRNADVRAGALTFAALCWVVLYAFAVTAAAFSGERESNTLGFLDALPVRRLTLWLGKSSFAVISTALLAVVLVGIAEVGTSERGISSDFSWPSLLRVFVPLLIEGLIWGLFWSAVSRNTLFAAVMTVVTVVLIVMQSPEPPIVWNPLIGSPIWRMDPKLLMLILAGIVGGLGSLAAITWRSDWPLSLIPGRSTRSAQPIVIRKASTNRSLFWQVGREGWLIGVMVAVLSLFVPMIYQVTGARFEGILDFLLVSVAALVAGVSVFGSENGPGSREFLVHQGVKAGAVWWRRFVTWAFALVLILAVFAVSSADMCTRVNLGSPVLLASQTYAEQVGILAILGGNAFAIGILCGMAIRRLITAVLVGTMVWIILVPPQFALLAAGMIPAWSLVLVPLILVGISAAWARDWLVQPEGFRRWFRLAVFVLVPSEILAIAYIAYRALGVGDFPPVAGATPLDFATLPADQNGAGLYRRAIGLIQPDEKIRLYGNGQDAQSLESVVDNLGFPDQGMRAGRFLEKNRPVIELTRRASGLAGLQFEPPDRQSLFSDDLELYRDLRILDLLLALETRERIGRGDLAGAWDDLLAQFRLANQMFDSSTDFYSLRTAAEVQGRAVRIAFEWLADPRQTLDSTRRALADLKALPPLPGLDRVLKLRSLLIERTLDLPGEELTAKLLGESGGVERHSTAEYLVYNWFVTPAWERRRARQICRKLTAELLPMSADEAWERDPAWQNEPPDLAKVEGSPLARSLGLMRLRSFATTLDRDLVSRRALDQLVALKVWKFDHDGKNPEKLDDLVPGLLSRLPIDPYSGKPFGYKQVDPATIKFPLLLENIGAARLSPDTQGRQALIYSVGPDLKDDGAKKTYGAGQKNTDADLLSGDQIFGVP